MNFTVSSYHVAYAFHSKSTKYVFLKIKELLAWNRRDSWCLSGSNEIQTYNDLVRQWTLNHLANWPNGWAELGVLICTVHLPVCSYHFNYLFQSESTLYICLKVKEILARNTGDLWSLSDCNRTPTHNHLVRKWTLNHLAKLTKGLNWVVSTYMYGAFAGMFLSCEVRISE